MLPLPFIGCGTKPEAEAPKEETPKKDKLTFAFLTDVHLSRDNRGEGNDGLARALEDTKARQADFLLFGGDNVETDHMKRKRPTWPKSCTPVSRKSSTRAGRSATSRSATTTAII